MSKKINFIADDDLVNKIEKIKRITGIIHTSEIIRMSISRTEKTLAGGGH